jgi:hypothetical protein
VEKIIPGLGKGECNACQKYLVLDIRKFQNDVDMLKGHRNQPEEEGLPLPKSQTQLIIFLLHFQDVSVTLTI